MAKTMKDVTGDGKFTYADVLKLRGVKLQKYGGKVMQEGGRPPRMEEMASIIPYLKIGGGHRYPIEFENQVKEIQAAFDAGDISASKRDDMIEEVGRMFFNETRDPSGRVSGTIIDNPSKRAAMEGRGLMEKGGTVDYGMGGAVLGGINALMEGKGLGGAALAAGKGFITPGSGVAQGINLAGNLMQSPMAQNLINQFTAKRGMVVPNAKVRLLKLER